MPSYEVYAIRYAERDGRRPAHFVGGDPHDAPMPMDYFVWFVRNAERTIVVDTGFSAEVAARRGRHFLRSAHPAGACGTRCSSVRTRSTT